MISNRRSFSRRPAAASALAASTAAVATLAAFAGIALPQPASADPLHMTPGLWEQTVTTKSQSGQMEAKMAEAQARLDALPPDQRAMVQAQMQAHGVQMAPGGKGSTVRVCVSKEMSERDGPPKDGRCEQQQVERNGATTHFKLVCPGNPPSTGEGTFTMTSATSYTGTMSFNTIVQGKPERMDSTMTGRYLGSDCGDVKPAR
jgi:hypothetical protein